METLIEGAYVQAIIGGMMIGASVSFMMLYFGRIAGISGIVAGAVFGRSMCMSFPISFDRGWRLLFLIGMLVGAAVAYKYTGMEKPEVVSANALTIVVSGLLVGIGVTLAKGCTSGHGICGVSRLSARSIIATFCFMLSAIVTVLFVRYLF